MVPADIAAVSALSDRIHPDYPERPAVLAEKLHLFPAGCFALETAGGDVAGYCFSHPWSDMPPALDCLLGQLPAEPAVYFIHDLTIDGSQRGHNLPRAVVTAVRGVAAALGIARLTLVAVNNSGGFWRRLGFRPTPDTLLQAAARTKYGAAAIHMDMLIDE